MPRVLPLHPRHCDGSEHDVQRFLADGLLLDPEALNRLSYISHHSYYGCQTKIPNANHATALMSACMLDHTRCVQYLLGRGADPTIVDAHRMPAVFYAVAEGNIGCLRLLCDQGASVEHVDEDGNKTSLFLLKAIEMQNADCLEELLRNGASVFTPGSVQPVAKAFRAQSAACLRVLLLNGARFDDLAHPDALDFRQLWLCSSHSVRQAEQNLSKKARIMATMCRMRPKEELVVTSVEFGLELEEDGVNLFDVLRQLGTINPDDLQMVEQVAMKQVANRSLSSLTRSVVRDSLGADNYLKNLPHLRHPTNGRPLLGAPSLRHVLLYQDLL